MLMPPLNVSGSARSAVAAAWMNLAPDTSPSGLPSPESLVDKESLDWSPHAYGAVALPCEACGLVSDYTTCPKCGWE